jgi:hypothetical protein
MSWANLSSTDLGDTYCPAPASGRVSGTPSINATCSSFSDLGNTYDDEQWRETWDYDGANGTGNYVCMSATGTRTHNACKQYCSHMNKLCNTTAGVTHCNANPQFNFSGDINQIIALGHDAAWWIQKTYCQNYWDPGNSSLPRPQTSASVDVNLSFGGQTIPVVMSCNGGDNNPAEKNWCSVTKPFSVGGASYTVTLRVGASLPSDQSPTYITQTCIDIN